MSARKTRKRKAAEAPEASVEQKDADAYMEDACPPRQRKRLKVELRAHRAPRVIDTAPDGQEQLRREETNKDRFEARVRQLLLNGAFDQVDPETAQTKSDLAATQAPSVKQQLFNELSFQINKSKTEVQSLQRFLDQLLQGQGQASSLLQSCAMVGPKQSKNTKQVNGMVQAKQKKAALVSAARRLTSFAASAKERVRTSRKHLEDVKRLRRQWRLGLVPDGLPPSQRPVVATSHFVVEYGLAASGSTRVSTGMLQQTGDGAKLELAPYSINKSLKLVVEELEEIADEHEKSGSTRSERVACLSSQLIPSIASAPEGAAGLLNVHRLLNNALWSLVTMDAFQELSLECVRSRLPNVRKEETSVKSSPTYKDSLDIQVVSADEEGNACSPSESGGEGEQRRRRELLYDLETLHFVIVRLYLSKYRFSLRESLDHRAVRNSVVPPAHVRILATVVAIHAHLCIRKLVESMLDSLSQGLSGCSEDGESTAKLSMRQFAAVAVHWLATGEPTVAAVDLVFESCEIGLTIRGTEISVSGYHRIFTSVDEVRDQIVTRLCASILGTVSKEFRAMGRAASTGDCQLLCENLFPGHLLTIEFSPHGNSVKGRVLCKNMMQTTAVAWSSIPGSTNQAKTCFLLSLQCAEALSILSTHGIH